MSSLSEKEDKYTSEPSRQDTLELLKDASPPVKDEQDWGETVPATDLTESVFKDSGNSMIGGGGFGDVYKGVWVDRPTTASTPSFIKSFNKFTHLYDKAVAIKVIRSLVAEGKLRDAVKRVSESFLWRRQLTVCGQRLAREIGLWQRLHHENILPLVGVSYNFGELPAPISLWQANGKFPCYMSGRNGLIPCRNCQIVPGSRSRRQSIRTFARGCSWISFLTWYVS